MMTEAVWELQDLLDSLHAAKASPGDNEFGTVSELGFLNLADYDYEADQWYLTPAGTALLALLEVEHCKRRIEAAGWTWCDGPYTGAGGAVGISVAGHLDWEEFDTMAEAAEYAEAHAQGGGTDGAQG